MKIMTNIISSVVGFFSVLLLFTIIHYILEEIKIFQKKIKLLEDNGYVKQFIHDNLGTYKEAWVSDHKVFSYAEIKKLSYRRLRREVKRFAKD